MAAASFLRMLLRDCHISDWRATSCQTTAVFPQRYALELEGPCKSEDLSMPLSCPSSYSRVIRFPLFAAVVATALLSAGEALATLDLTGDVSCTNSGGGSGGCFPISDPLGSGFQYVSGGMGTDLWFSINADSSSITLTFTGDALGNFGSSDMNVLQLLGIQTNPDELIEIDSVDFIGTWISEPDELPSVGNSGLPGNIASISWDLGGAKPSALDSARINLNFTPVPEPGTALLMGLGLLGLGVVGKSRREESDPTD
jgi:hypothetical protein